MTVTFDGRGRRTSVTYAANFSDGPTSGNRLLTMTERAQFGPTGDLRGVILDRSDGKHQTVTARTTVGPDGTRTVVFRSHHAGPHGEPTDYRQTLTYRPDGRLTRERQELNGKLWIDGSVLTYNAHGDVASADVISYGKSARRDRLHVRVRRAGRLDPPVHPPARGTARGPARG